MKRFARIMVAALGALLATASGALADITCTVANSPLEGPVDGNVVVPAGNGCTLLGATVAGNVTVGGSLYIDGRSIYPISTIAGNLQANSGCTYVEINPYGAPYNTIVSGNVQIANCTGRGNPYYPGEAFGARGKGSIIFGNFQCQNNAASCILANVVVFGNVQVNNNTSTPGTPSEIVDNTIFQDLQCENNSPSPTGLSTNLAVFGNPGQSSEGQCLNF